MRYLTVLMVLTVLASSVPAKDWFEIQGIGSPAPLGSGYVTTNIIMNPETDDWAWAELLIELTAGSIYQTPTFGQRYPQPGLWSSIPELEYDSFLTNGRLEACSYNGHARDLGGDVEQFDTEEIDITWYDAADNNTGTGLLMARITLSSDAQGTWKLMSSFTLDMYHSVKVTMEGNVVNGIIPEPSSAILVTVGILVLLKNDRRLRSLALRRLGLMAN